MVFKGKPSLLPFYVSDKFFTIEFADNINFGHISLMKKGRSNSFHYLGKLERSLSRISLIWMNFLFILIILN
jgi:hypothetical protein